MLLVLVPVPATAPVVDKLLRELLGLVGRLNHLFEATVVGTFLAGCWKHIKSLRRLRSCTISIKRRKFVLLAIVPVLALLSDGSGSHSSPQTPS